MTPPQTVQYKWLCHGRVWSKRSALPGMKRLLGHFVHSTEEDPITEGELMTMVSEAENDGELTDRESEL